MSEIIRVIADTCQTLRELTQLLGAAEGTTAEPLLADLELQITWIECEGARLWHENLEMHRHLLSLRGAHTRSAPHTTHDLLNPRQTMQKVSEFYQMNARKTRSKRAA
jgi:hypothetical protein